eukprot:scaffold5297_cov104-Cylindrotheca_fusiformis.AAC.1
MSRESNQDDKFSHHHHDTDDDNGEDGDDLSSEMLSGISTSESITMHSRAGTGGDNNNNENNNTIRTHKSKSKGKKLKKNFKKIIKIAKKPYSAIHSSSSSDKVMKEGSTTNSPLVPIAQIDPSSGTNNNSSHHKKKKKKKKKGKEYETQISDEDNENDDGADFISLVKYEKIKSALAEKSDLVDTLLSKIQLLEETIREKDEVIIRLQNIDILQQTIQEKNEIIHRLQLHDEVPENTFTKEFKSNAKLLNEIRKKKRELENFRTDFRLISSTDLSLDDGLTDEANDNNNNNENLFLNWKRHDTKIKKEDSARDERSTPQPIMSKSESAEIAKTKRLESSDLLHRLRKENAPAIKAAPKKKAAEPWKAVHTFLLPAFEKSVAERTLIRKALEENYVFENLRAASVETFIQAFENVQVHKDHVIMKQGNSVDYFYIVADGEVTIEKSDGKLKRGGPGTCIGETALLYSAARIPMVVAQSEPTQLFRVDQKTFRYTMRRTVKEANRKKMDLLKSIKILQDFDQEDLQRLCDNMVDKKFLPDEIVVSKEDTTAGAFYVVMSGSMKVTGLEDTDAQQEAQLLIKGDYFGEQALISNASPSANLIGVKKGYCFCIDTETFDKVLGNFSRVTTRSKDKALLSQVKLMKDAEFEDSLLKTLADVIVDEEYKAKEKIQEKGKLTVAALYLVREGSVTVSTKDFKQVIKAGQYFGADQLLADSRGEADRLGQMVSHYTAICDKDTVCGVLTLMECRLCMDTSTAFKPKTGEIPYDPREFLTIRRSEHRRVASFDDLSMDFMNERKRIRDFYKSLNTPIDLLPRDKILGEGQFGQVWKVTIGPENHRRDFALKIQDLSEAFHSDCLENIYREMKIISSLQHPFIVDLIDSKETDTDSYMLMTLCTGGELWNVIHKVHDDGSWESGVKEEDAKFYSLIVADTVAYMHRKNVLFRDLKPENVLIDADGYPNIIDFGFAKITTEKTFTLCGTPNYMAPEIILVSGHSVGADHWALGIMIYEMISGEHPFYYEGLDNSALFEVITKAEPYPCERASYEAKNLISGLLEKDPTQRLGVLAGKERDILKHKWFDDLDLNKLRNKQRYNSEDVNKKGLMISSDSTMVVAIGIKFQWCSDTRGDKIQIWTLMDV